MLPSEDSARTTRYPTTGGASRVVPCYVACMVAKRPVQKEVFTMVRKPFALLSFRLDGLVLWIGHRQVLWIDSVGMMRCFCSR